MQRFQEGDRVVITDFGVRWLESRHRCGEANRGKVFTVKRWGRTMFDGPGNVTSYSLPGLPVWMDDDLLESAPEDR